MVTATRTMVTLADLLAIADPPPPPADPIPDEVPPIPVEPPAEDEPGAPR